MKFYIGLLLLLTSIMGFNQSQGQVPKHLKNVDQILWIIEDIETVKSGWLKLGFNQIIDLGEVNTVLKSTKRNVKLRIAKANLGGAYITWIQPLEGKSVFRQFHQNYGDGAMSLVHRLESRAALDKEIQRLGSVGVEVAEEVIINTDQGSFEYILMNTLKKGKYVLGYTYGSTEADIKSSLSSKNQHSMHLNQYAFVVKDEKTVSSYWRDIGFPEFVINFPELGNKVYYGKEANYDLRQGWQRHGIIDYEWCIPVKSPTVYEDHIRKHGEGIHHLAFTVDSMDKVIRDYESKGYIVSMAGTWGEKGKPGSGIYTYIDLESTGGLTMELLWNYKEEK